MYSVFLSLQVFMNMLCSNEPPFTAPVCRRLGTPSCRHAPLHFSWILVLGIWAAAKFLSICKLLQ